MWNSGEDKLGAPKVPAAGEIVLILQDHNLSVVHGKLGLIHKMTDVNPGFFGPLTLVNGKLWPSLRLHPEQAYRLHLLNGTNARCYRLHLLSINRGKITLHHERLQTIVTGAVLLEQNRQPSKNEFLTLSPGEQLEVLLTLEDLSPGEQLYLVNSAPTHTDSDDTHAHRYLEDLIANGNYDNLNPYPQVLRIDISGAADIWNADTALYSKITNVIT